MKRIPAPVMIFDPTLEVSYPMFSCPSCRENFHSGGHPIHDFDVCKLEDKTSYAPLHVHFGRRFFSEELALSRGGNADATKIVERIKTELPAIYQMLMTELGEEV